MRRLLRAACAALVFSSPARAAALPPPAYFQSLNAQLKAAGLARPVILIDLDRLDHNVDVVEAALGSSFRLRVVEKSLPSPELLAYVLKRAGTNRVMAFHFPFFKAAFEGLPPDTDFLLGKPVPIAGVREFFDSLPRSERAAAARRFSWLVDSPADVGAYAALFKARRLPLNLNVELDVGLHRGGVRSPAELDAVLDAVSAASATLTGFMGYDGQVADLPLPEAFGLKRFFMRRALAGVERRYRALRAELDKYPKLRETAAVFDGGGSATYSLYKEGSALNELALGSGLLMPSDYDRSTLSAHEPAIFIAAPILRRIHPARVAYIGRVSFDPDFDAFTVYGGGWADAPVYPRALTTVPFYGDTPNRNMVSNQTLLWGDPDAEAPGLGAGDFVFYRPVQSDALFLFEDILLVRGGKLAGTWHPFPERY